MAQTIIAIGGGDIRTRETAPIDREIIRRSNKKHPKLLFIPTASSDSQNYWKHIQEYFGDFLKCKTDALFLLKEKPSKTRIRRKIESADIIYVGGGNTLMMMRLWRRLGVDKLLRFAYANGTVLCGISAGSICWFEWGLSDSVSCGKFEPLRCLGYLPGSNCPHFDGEPGRQKIFRNLIARNQIPAGYAADDGVALHFVNEKLVEAVSIKSSANAYQISPESGKARQIVIRPRLLNHE